MSRVSRWDIVLAEEIAAVRELPFEWGEHDCASWSLSVVCRLRGEDPPDWIGSYKTKTGALRKLSESEVKIEDIGSTILGDPMDNVLFAQRGDLVFSGGAYGICVGSMSAHIGEDGKKGLVFIPMSAAERAWRT